MRDPKSTTTDASMIADVLKQVEAVDARIGGGLEELGGYQILGVLGQGGMGVVYRARQKNPNRDVALKVLRSHLATGDAMRRFDKEAHVLGRLHHIGIAQIFEAGTADSGFGLQPFFALELVEGLPVTDHAEVNKLNARERFALVARICDAIEHAHQNNIIHRDIKPSNILVDDTGQPKVLDFGVARIADAEAQAATMRTEARNLVGTLPYMSPEQVRGASKEIDRRTDVYSLGVLIYRLLTGRYPFHVSQTSIPESIRAIQDDEPTRLSLFDRSLRGDAETIVLKSMEKEPERRYQSCAEFGADIRHYLNNEPIRARPAGKLYRFSKFARRNRALVVGAASVFLALSIGLALTSRASTIAERRLEDFRRLADARDLDLYKAEARRLWPAEPSNVNGLKAWITKAETLRPRMLSYRRQLAALHERAIEKNLVKQLDRRGVRMSEELFEVRDMLATARKNLVSIQELTTPTDESKRRAMQFQIDQLLKEERRIEAAIPKEHMCRFTDRADVLQHDILVELVRDMEAFFDPLSGTVNDVKRRLHDSQHISEDSIDRHRDDWRSAIAAIRDKTESPHYVGLVIKEQIGLVPLGADPSSGFWEFAHLQSGKIPQRSDNGTLEITDASGMVFVLIPGGLSTIGARPPARPDEIGEAHVDPLAAPDEQPVQSVSLSPFFISKFEMTQAQWQRVTGTDPSRFQPEYDHPAVTRMNPVENISWETTSEVLWQLGMSLPTEAQWEYAARGWTSTPWWCGSDPAKLAGVANMANRLSGDGNSYFATQAAIRTDHDLASVHMPIGQYRANPFGLHDILGNVAEWCYDSYGSYEIRTRDDNGKRESGRGVAAQRVIRGGSFEDGFAGLRSSARGHAAIEFRAGTVGVRPARALSY